MSAILDNITGGGLLPYIYCKKTTIEDSSIEGKLDITLHLELYQDKKRLLDSAWLNSLDDNNSNFLDAMFIQVLEYKTFANVRRISPSAVRHGVFNFSGPGRGSLYGGKIVYGDNYLPRGGTGGLTGPRPNVENMFNMEEGSIKTPVQVSNSSIIGNIGTKDALLNFEAEGKVREEIVNGRPYYVIPFQHKTIYDPEQNENLGFAFYTFLDVPYWANSLDIGVEILPSDSFFEEFVVEGPVNSEVIYMAGQLQQEREAFFLPNGQVWEGAAHVHSDREWLNNPAPDGYVGDGGLSNLDNPSDYRGWMVGEQHNSAEDQPKLKLARVPNNKLLDLRSTTKGKNLEEVSLIGTSAQQRANIAEQSAFDKMLDQVGAVFQKEKRREFIIDNDSEYSKLYLTRDVNGSARGIFFINMEELLKNNSQLYPNTSGLSDYLIEILSRSSFLELKIYRDRVKEHIIGKSREVYANDEAYEEPAKLVATLSPHGSTAAAKSTEDSTFAAVNISADDDNKIRYFMFSDHEVASKSAGMYQYRLEVNFKDGSYQFLYEVYKELSNSKILLEKYYDLAVSSYTDPASAGFAHTSRNQAKEFTKARFKRYYKNNSYDQQFSLRAYELFSETTPWTSVPVLISQVQKIFQGQLDFMTVLENSLSLTNSLDPITGSPKGIQNVLGLISLFIKKIEAILEINKLKKTSGGFTSSAYSGGHNNTSLLKNFISQANHTIYEEHTFDHPAELYEATSNKRIYSDYLSLDGNPESATNQVLKVVNVGDFVERCRAEVAKYSLKPLVPQEGEGSEYNIDAYSQIGSAGQGDSAQPPAQDDTPRYLSDTGYSYLAPSVIELSSGVQGNNFSYRPMQDDFNTENAENLLVALLNYSFNKEDEKNADLLDAPFSYEQLGRDYTLRETYKELFEKLGITTHDVDLHDSFFQDSEGNEREAGAISVDTPEAGATIINTPFGAIGSIYSFQYKIQDFSDGDVTPNTFFKNFSNNDKLATKKLKAYNINLITQGDVFDAAGIKFIPNLPNNFKLPFIRNNHKNFVDEEIATLPWRAISNNPEPYNTYLFFNLNLTMKIEVFRGSAGNAKYDQESWSLLTKEDIDNIDNTSGTLLCRMSYFDERLTKDLRLPILDRYFLMTPGAAISGIAAVEQINQMTLFASQDDVAQNTFWADQNEQKMDEYAESTGQTFAFAGGVQAAGQSNMQSSDPQQTQTNTQTSQSESEPAGPTFAVSTPTGGGSSDGGY